MNQINWSASRNVLGGSDAIRRQTAAISCSSARRVSSSSDAAISNAKSAWR